jgi:hypothetical protein
MAVTAGTQRKVVEVLWDNTVVLGSHASMQINDEEKRNVDNDGKANLTFPNSFTGSVKVTVKGSRTGEETGDIEVK